MKNIVFYIGFAFLVFGCNNVENNKRSEKKVTLTFAVKNGQITQDWRNALKRRMSTKMLDSFSKISRPVTQEELDWKDLIASKLEKWNTFRDSLKIPFENTALPDSIVILLGFNGRDDAFTYKNNTVCFDVSALSYAYGSAKKKMNDNRIDRIFSHEFTHLLSKKWVKNNNLKLRNFKDSILWECTYEGFGMYRSMSKKWLPVGDSLSQKSKETFEDLYPKFVDRIIRAHTKTSLSNSQKREIHHQLSKGPMNKKWGALPVGVWLAFEAKGDDKNLIPWIQKGPDAILELAEKHLTGESKKAFDTFLETLKDKN
jgi:hypothetical protein